MPQGGTGPRLGEAGALSAAPALTSASGGRTPPVGGRWRNSPRGGVSRPGFRGGWERRHHGLVVPFLDVRQGVPDRVVLRAFTRAPRPGSLVGVARPPPARGIETLDVLLGVRLLLGLQRLDEILGTLAQLPGVADADRRGEEPDLLSRHPRSVVADGERAGTRVADHVDASAREARLLQSATHDRIVRVLHQLADRDGGRRVEVRSQHRHQPAEVDLRRVNVRHHRAVNGRRSDRVCARGERAS